MYFHQISLAPRSLLTLLLWIFYVLLRNHSDHFPPRNLSQKLDDALINIPCESAHIVIANLLTLRPVEMTGWRETLRYPQNLARNTAKHGCPTAYTMVPDSDMIPIPGMATKLHTFLSKAEQQECTKCAYVVPVYEIKSTIGRDVMPTDKTELMLLVERYFARRFHQTVYLLNQLSSDLDRWRKAPSTKLFIWEHLIYFSFRWEALPSKNETEAAFEVTKYLFKYEPIYIARAETPIFDERFIGFGMTRNTQSYEMYLAGYKFVVLNNLFLNHWGLQKRETRPHWRQLQHLLNNRLFKGFAKELSARYNKYEHSLIMFYEIFSPELTQIERLRISSKIEKLPYW